MAVEVGQKLEFSLNSTTGTRVTPADLLQDQKALVITGFPLAFTPG